MTRNTLPFISKWKIFDNLRRSLVAPSLLVWLVASWTILPGPPWLWTLFAIVVVSFPIYAHLTTSLFSHPRGVPWTSYFWHVWGDFGTNTKQVLLTLVFLPHQAWMMVDAILRVTYRKMISGKHLLEWTTAAQTESGSRHDIAAFWRMMFPVTLFAIAVAICLSLYRPPSLLIALPFLIAWALSPQLAYFVSSEGRSLKDANRELNDDERLAMRLVARRTWRFFETFVGPDDHWLPPDNFQEDPHPLIAHRTSPTNIGLLLLSTSAARDFGYLGLHETVERLELTMASLKKLEKFQGHLFNWYDTKTLAPLNPQYISTVDSGNLAAHLIALKQAAIELPGQKIFDTRLLDGLMDTLVILRGEVQRIDASVSLSGVRSQVVTSRELSNEIEACVGLIESMKSLTDKAGSSGDWAKFFKDLSAHAGEAEDIAYAMEQEQGVNASEDFAEFHSWTSLLLDQSNNISFGAATVSCSSSHLPSIRGRMTRAISKVMCPACARMAVNILMGLCGR